MDILFFIGQALAIAAIGYVVAQAFVYRTRRRRRNRAPIGTRSNDGAAGIRGCTNGRGVRAAFVRARERVRTEDLMDQASEEPGSLRKAA